MQAQNTVKQYKNGVQALSGLNLTVKTGEIFSLLGQNGAGKSTLIKILTTYLKPNLEQYRKYPVSSYSGGVKRRLDIALNMMSNPKILFLNEPTVGMDIKSRMSMWEMMKKIRDDFGTTIFLTTHYLQEADHLSDRVCIMKDGKDVIQGTPFELRSFIRQDSIKVYFTTKSEAKKYFVVLKEHYAQKSMFVRNTTIITHTKDSHADMERIVKILLEQHIPFHGIEITQPTLEDVFLRLT